MVVPAVSYKGLADDTLKTSETSAERGELADGSEYSNVLRLAELLMYPTSVWRVHCMCLRSITMIHTDKKSSRQNAIGATRELYQR